MGAAIQHGVLGTRPNAPTRMNGVNLVSACLTAILLPALVTSTIAVPSHIRDCPSFCECTPSRSGGVRLECHDGDKTFVPRIAPLNTDFLDLSGSENVKLDNTSFQDKTYADIREIDMSRCNLTSLPPGIFDPLKKLKRLDLRYNNLTYDEIVKLMEGLNEQVQVLIGGNQVDCDELRKKYGKRIQCTVDGTLTPSTSTEVISTSTTSTPAPSTSIKESSTSTTSTPAPSTSIEESTTSTTSTPSPTTARVVANSPTSTVTPNIPSLTTPISEQSSQDWWAMLAVVPIALFIIWKMWPDWCRDRFNSLLRIRRRDEAVKSGTLPYQLTASEEKGELRSEVQRLT